MYLGELSTGATSNVSYSDVNKIIILTNVSYSSDNGNKEVTWFI